MADDTLSHAELEAGSVHAFANHLDPKTSICLTYHLSSCCAAHARVSCGWWIMLCISIYIESTCMPSLFVLCCAAGMRSVEAPAPGQGSVTAHAHVSISSLHWSHLRGAVGLPCALPEPAGFL